MVNKNFPEERLLLLLSFPPHHPSVKIARRRPEFRRLRCKSANTCVCERDQPTRLGARAIGYVHEYICERERVLDR